MVDPAVAFVAQLQALGLVLDQVGVGALAVEEDPLEELKNTNGGNSRSTVSKL